MLKLPADLNQQFHAFLTARTIPHKESAFYKKWLRFYWDFCHKYHHDAFHADSLPLFLQKLQEKRQSELQQNQAKQAVSLFYEMHTASKQPLTRNKSVSSQSQQSVNRIKAPSNNSLQHISKISVVHDPL